MNSSSQAEETAMKLTIVVLFAMAFAYIESAVVVYLRAIFSPDGFNFPITDFGNMLNTARYLLTETAREAATIVIIFASAYLFGKDVRRRWAYFLIIFAIWDIFYYIWLKVLLDWPASLLDWDILFLIPTTWAAPVLAPVITSLVMLFIAAILLTDRTVSVPKSRSVGFIIITAAIIVSFCIAGTKITTTDYSKMFSWPIFLALHVAVIILFLRCTGKKTPEKKND